MDNNAINRFVAKHIGKQAKANKTAAAKPVSNGVGPIFPAQSQPGFPKVVKGKKGPVGTTKKKSNKKSNGLDQHIHIHVHGYSDNEGDEGGY